MERIVSTKNERVVQWAKLATEKGRKEQGAFLAEGPHLVSEALLWDIPPVALLYDETRSFPQELEPFLNGKLPWYAVSSAVMRKLSDAQTPQSVLAVFSLPQTGEVLTVISSGLEGNRGIKGRTVLLVDAVQDPGNLGSLLRSADAFGVDAVLLGRGTVDPYNAKALRASMGSLFHLSVYKVDLSEALLQLGNEGFVTVAADLGGSSLLHEYEFPLRTALVVGNEAKGIAPSRLALVRERIRIAMPGHAESLNVSMAATVLLYERMRQKRYSTQINSSLSK